MKYGQFCPIAKALEVLGERWTLLVVRELMSGATRYAELQRGLGRISPSVLSARLKALTDHGIVERFESEAGAGWEYRLTSAGLELAPIVETMGVWGQRWVRSTMSREELDVELLMIHLQRNFDVRAFPKDHAVVAFVFKDQQGPLRCWWLLLDNGETELCARSPGRAEDVKLICGVRTLAEVFTGDDTLQHALETRRLEVRGAPKLVRKLQHWLRPSPLAGVARANAS